MQGKSKGVRAIALVGPVGAGKTSLAEALLYASETIDRQGSVESGSSVGDASAEARARQGSTEINLMHFSWLGDRFAIIDSPGASGFDADALRALPAADMAVVVIDPDPARAALAEPTLKRLEAIGLPHAIFVNKIDQARGSIQALLEALQPMSAAPLVARQIPIREGERVTGFVDLALERAYHYRPGKEAERIEIPPELAEREAKDRFHMLEQLADHDDSLLEQLLMDETPELATVFADLVRETRASLVVPVLFGSAKNDFGVRRLMKLLRHEAPEASVAAERLGVSEGTAAFVFKTSHGSQVGRLALARAFGGRLGEGAELWTPEGATVRAGALFAVQGAATARIAAAEPGEVIAIAKTEGVSAGTLLGPQGRPIFFRTPAPPEPSYALAIATRDRKDDVRLSAALNKLVEEDPALRWEQDEALHETRLRGANEDHLATTIEKLRRRYGVAVDARRPTVAYRESIRRGATQRGRHKKQSGGHGQFGDVVIEVRPLDRGAGFEFSETITGGAIPRQWFPAVEQGIRDAMEKGPLGFPVVDVAVTLVDGSYHSVDSSELAFRTAGRIAMSEALAACAPYLLEPVCRLTVHAPGGATSKVGSAISARRGQILGIAPREDWARWDTVEALIPQAELHELGPELRSLSQGLASFSTHVDHLAELNGRHAEEVVQRMKVMA